MVRVDFMKTFREVAKERSLNKAAKNLGLSVSTVSFQISSLEDFYGAKLIRRGASGVEITEEGKIVLKSIETVLSAIEEAKRLISNVKGEKVVIASGVVGLNVVHVIQTFLKSKYPNLEVRLELRGAHDCVEGILDGKYDFAIAGDIKEEYRTDQRLFIQEIGEDQLVLIVSPEHPLAKKRVAKLEDLKKEPLIMLGEEYGITTSTKKALEASGISFSELNVVHVEDYYSKLHAVSNGLGVAITSHLAVCRVCGLGLVKVVPVADLKSERKIYFVSSKIAMEKEKIREYAQLISLKSRQIFEELTATCKCFGSI
ncbi:MAG: LysR family transcriptional regulator [Archaeoglobus sp.]|nr:LysR family transcriptional regulator [Archaeoglobus sp.]